MECRDLFLILLPVGKLCPDFFDGAVAPVGEPRGEFFGTVFAEISVFQLAVTEQADLFPANIAIFLIKQSHTRIALYYAAACSSALELSIAP